MNVLFCKGVTPVKRTFIRILGITGGSLTLLPYLLFISKTLYTLALPDSEVHFESKGYAYGFLIIYAIPTLIAAVGFAGSLIMRRHILSAVFMVFSGTLTLVFSPPVLISGTRWLLLIPSLMLVAAGVLKLIFRPDVNQGGDSAEKNLAPKP
jgi:hypothetical protein